MKKHLVSPQSFESTIEWRKLTPLSTTRQVAEFIGIKEKTLREWRSKKSPLSPPFVRYGRSVFYERDVLHRWYEETILEPLRRKGVNLS